MERNIRDGGIDEVRLCKTESGITEARNGGGAEVREKSSKHSDCETVLLFVVDLVDLLSAISGRTDALGYRLTRIPGVKQPFVELGTLKVTIDSEEIVH